MTPEQFVIKLFIGGEFTVNSFIDDDGFIEASFKLMREDWKRDILWGFIGEREGDKLIWCFDALGTITKTFDVEICREKNLMIFKENK